MCAHCGLDSSKKKKKVCLLFRGEAQEGKEESQGREKCGWKKYEVQPGLLQVQRGISGLNLDSFYWLHTHTCRRISTVELERIETVKHIQNLPGRAVFALQHRCALPGSFPPAAPGLASTSPGTCCPVCPLWDNVLGLLEQIDVARHMDFIFFLPHPLHASSR